MFDGKMRFISRFSFVERIVPFAPFLIRHLFRVTPAIAMFLLILGASSSHAAGPPSSSTTSDLSQTVSSPSASIALCAVLPPTLTLNVSILYLKVPIARTNVGSPVISVPVTSSWRLNASASAVQLIAFFETRNEALVDVHGYKVPSSRVLGGINADSMQPFVEGAAVGTPGASRILFRQPISPQNVTGSRTDNLQLQIAPINDLNLPKGIYSGTLHLRLVAI